MVLGLGEPAESEHYTDDSPDYPLLSAPALTTLGVAAVLFVATLGLMVLLRGTIVASATLFLFRLSPLIGAVVFGILLTIGYNTGLEAAAQERYGPALGACALLAGTYGAFGAAILTLYAPSLTAPALVWTTGVTVAITLAAGALVYTSDRSFAGWRSGATVLMTVGLGALLVHSFAELLQLPATVLGPLLYIAFAAILLGWIAHLVYEIHMVSEEACAPAANGIGLYVGFVGVFVHVLQLVLRVLRRR